MNNKLIIISLLAVIVLMGAPMASARSGYLESFNQHYDTEGTRLDSCTTCHNGEARNPYGKAYSGSGRDFTAIEDLDSDGDGSTNLVEINALTFPGNPGDYPQNISETPSETTVNATEPSASATPEQTATEVPVNNTTGEQSATEVPVSNATPEQPATEAPGNTTEEEQTPGFEVVHVLVGLLAVACLKRRNIRK